MRRAVIVVLVALAAAGASGCGSDDVPGLSDAQREAERLRDRALEARERVERTRDRLRDIREEARRVGDELAQKVRDALDDLQQAVPRATPATQPPRVQGRSGTTTIDAFLTETLRSVDRYWTQTFAASDLPEPRVRFSWVPPNRVARSACGEPADDQAAFYCPADDTIYVGQVLAAGVYRGVVRGFPGEQAGQGRAAGDFGVAYLVAHEYAHNLQQELGFFSSGRRGGQARPFELQADCMAGLWGSSVYRAGLLQEGDVQEAMDTALAVGDFEVGSQQHHGTPTERRDAWLLGFESGTPADCSAFVRA
ncbi:MAG TPA: neutral zinc metallopeptidase [Baekduia sp.]|nr:neutral zinc metallopeptidase [Baekduia sp.]